MYHRLIELFVSSMVREVIDSGRRPINEGGLGGHMSHIYENKELKFSDIKNIFGLATLGRLEGVQEKFDGQNMFFTYNLPMHELRFARNKGHLKTGGMSSIDIANKWAGVPNVKNAFHNAYTILNRAIAQLDQETIKNIFGPEGNTWFSMEVLYSGNPNVINYGQNALVFHTSSLTIDSTGNIVSGESSEAGTKLLAAVDRLQAVVADTQWKIMRPAIVNLQKATGEDLYVNAASQLDAEISKYGLGDKNTIGDYVAARFMDFALKDADYPEDIKKQLANIFASSDIAVEEKKKMVKNIIGEGNANIIKYYLANNEQKILNFLIAPLEEIIHDFSVKILEGVHSALVLNPEEEVKRLRAVVEKQINAIKASGDERAMDVLAKSLKKLKSLDNITSTMEGIVFNFNGRAYKLTGSFAPVGQLLGIFRY